jgi:hypothetical protein
VTVTAPPRPPRPNDPVDREELEALVEALIEEAQQREIYVINADGTGKRRVTRSLAIDGVPSWSRTALRKDGP